MMQNQKYLLSWYKVELCLWTITMCSGEKSCNGFCVRVCQLLKRAYKTELRNKVNDQKGLQS